MDEGWEDRQGICDKLVELLKMTRGGRNVQTIEYDGENETALVWYEGGTGWRINLGGDSGLAMVKDIVERLL